MAENAVVRARVSEDVKREASEVLAEMGLTVSDAMRMTLTRIARERALPFEVTPNAQTAETLRKSLRNEDVRRYEDMDKLFEKLGM